MGWGGKGKGAVEFAMHKLKQVRQLWRQRFYILPKLYARADNPYVLSRNDNGAR